MQIAEQNDQLDKVQMISSLLQCRACLSTEAKSTWLAKVAAKRADTEHTEEKRLEAEQSKCAMLMSAIEQPAMQSAITPDVFTRPPPVDVIPGIVALWSSLEAPLACVVESGHCN